MCELIDFNVIVSDFHLDNFKSRFEKVMKTARKLEVTEPTYTIDKSEVDDDGYLIHHIHIVGKYPVYDGYRFLSKIDHVDRLIYSAPNVEGSFRQYLSECKCDHCHTDRDRNTTFIIEKDDGSVLQVGGSCLKYYINYKHLASLAAFFELMNEFDDDEWGGSGSAATRYIDLKKFLKLATRTIRDNGYFNSSCEFSTKEEIIGMMNNPAMSIYVSEMIKDTTYDAYVDSLLQYIANVDVDTDYVLNLKTIAEREFISERHYGFACSMIPFYDRYLQKKRESEKKALTSNHIGEIGVRQTFTAVIDKILSFEGFYGTTFYNIFTDENGNVIAWKGSTKLHTEDYVFPEEGTKVRFKATIKNHGEYNGVKQTEVSRATLEEIIE